MTGMDDSMYCSEQICIPPTYPYLLRQYAKAAIRSQPNDLLIWSTAYFRCLSLNIPPPVKPRLEYPIPRTYLGITPGWLRALLSQLPNTSTINFKVLWDRWIGACLEHHTLIQILVLGGFDDPERIPWLKFLGLCAAHLTEDLTHSMILICEIFTEEPEGGSAMIPVDVFVEVYKFLALIDASKEQVLRNYYFLDSLLALWREKKEKFKKAVEAPPEEEESSTTTEVAEEVIELEAEKKSVDEVISCPSMDQDIAADFMEFMAEEGEESSEISDRDGGDVAERSESTPVEEEDDGKKEEEMVAAEEEEQDDVEEQVQEAQEKQLEGMEEMHDEEASDEDQTKGYESLDTLEDKPDFTERDLKEDLARLKKIQMELAGETDDELEKYKCQLIEDMPMTDDQLIAVEHFQPPETDSETKSLSVHKDQGEQELPPEDDEREYEDVLVPAIPGIGGIVPMTLIQAVEKYMRETACRHQGMVMPRDIRHYDCPPLFSPEEVHE